MTSEAAIKVAIKDYIALHHVESAQEILSEVIIDPRRMKHFSFHCHLRDVDAVLVINYLKKTIK